MPEPCVATKRGFWIREQVASGRTGTGPANALALSDKQNMSVVLLTDGENNAGDIDPLVAAEIANAFDVRIYAIGVGSNGVAKIKTKDVADGDYLIEIRLLKALGDWDNPDHWETWLSPIITIDRPNVDDGKKPKRN